MICPHCGSSVANQSLYCSICGGSLGEANSSGDGFSLSEASTSVATVMTSAPAATTIMAQNSAQEKSYVRAVLNYQTFSCPNCGMSTLVSDDNGISAHCESCGSVIDIRTREVTVERHEHTHNYITYQNVTDQFDLSHDHTVVRGFAAAGQMGKADVVVPANQGITVIGDGFLFNSEITERVSLPEGIQRIGASAFCNCRNLKEIEIPHTVSMIDSSAFENCTSLKRVVIPDSVRLGENVFRGCTGLQQVIIGNGVMGGKGVFIACESLKEVSIGEATNVADSMFANCPSLMRVTFEGYLSIIDEYAFCDCRSLAEIEFPFGLTSIRGAAFRGCTSLSRVKVPLSLKNLGTNAFENCSSLREFDATMIDRIGDGVFKGCSALSRVQLNNALASIPPSMFENCKHLRFLSLPANLNKIGVRSFAGCSSLQECSLPPTVQSIPREAFEGCTCLTHVGNQAFTVGMRAFAECSNLLSIAVKGNISPQAFRDCRALENIEIGSDVKLIGDAAFLHAASLENLIIPNGVEVIDSSAFRGCIELKRVVVAASIRRIDHWAFYDCSKLEAVIFAGNSIPKIVSQAFGENPYLEALTAPMSAFANGGLDYLIQDVPTIMNITMSNFDESFVKDLQINLFGSKIVNVNGISLQWDAWIQSHWPAPDAGQVVIPDIPESPKKGFFGNMFG